MKVTRRGQQLCCFCGGFYCRYPDTSTLALAGNGASTSSDPLLDGIIAASYTVVSSMGHNTVARIGKYKLHEQWLTDCVKVKEEVEGTQHSGKSDYL